MSNWTLTEPAEDASSAAYLSAFEKAGDIFKRMRAQRQKEGIRMSTSSVAATNDRLLLAQILQLQAEVRELKAGAQPPSNLADVFCGAWSAKGAYSRGDLCMKSGSTWLAVTDRPQGAPGSSDGWRLFAKGARR